MGNQWLEKYQEKHGKDFSCYFLLRFPNEFSSFKFGFLKWPIRSAEHNGRVLQLIFERSDNKLGSDFIKACKNATFENANNIYKAGIVVESIGYKHFILQDCVLDIVKPIQVHETVNSNTGAFNLQLDIECANLDEIDFRYFKSQNFEREIEQG